MAKRPVKSGLPTRQQILDFIQSSDVPAGKREIAKAFGLKGEEKIALKRLLRDMGDEGMIDAGAGRAFHRLGGVPKVTVLRVVDVDDSGKAWALVSGAGEVFGAWTIENLTETRSVLIDNGAARRIEFDLQLAAVDDQRAEPSGGVDPWPVDDYWEWWL